jgi:hypothetical protein
MSDESDAISVMLDDEKRALHRARGVWTEGLVQGDSEMVTCSNASDAYLLAVQAVQSFRVSEKDARAIVSTLAFKHGMAPDGKPVLP